MSVKIWDTSSQAFKDTDIPKMNAGGVWQDTEGMVWNGSAWVEGWSPKIDPLITKTNASGTNPSGTSFCNPTAHYPVDYCFNYDVAHAEGYIGSVLPGDANNGNFWFGFQFNKKVCVRQVYTKGRAESGRVDWSSLVKRYKLQASNDGVTYVDLGTSSILPYEIYAEDTLNVTQYDKYYYYRLYILEAYQTTYVGFLVIQMYGY